MYGCIYLMTSMSIWVFQAQVMQNSTIRGAIKQLQLSEQKSFQSPPKTVKRESRFSQSRGQRIPNPRACHCKSLQAKCHSSCSWNKQFQSASQFAGAVDHECADSTLAVCSPLQNMNLKGMYECIELTSISRVSRPGNKTTITI